MEGRRYYKRRYYRRRSRSVVATLVHDMVEICNRLPWWGAALMGVVMFSFFYWIVPAWIHHQWDSNPSRSPLGDLIRQVFERRLHWIQYLGIALGLIGAFFAVKNYFSTTRLNPHGNRRVGILARLLGRFLD